MLDSKARPYFQPVFEKMARTLLACGMTPVQGTLVAVAVGATAAIAVACGHLLLGVSLLWISGLFDVLDGSMARQSKTSSAIGTLMDIVFDRVVEIMVLLAVMFTSPALAVPTALVFASIILSMTVFLTVGALAEKMGNKSFYYQAGLMERTEAFVALSLIVLLPAWRAGALLLLAAAILFTAGQRFAEAMRLLK
ncbi:MAG: CDP-alcohol phosphatidyltransferase family protein [Firmicutes bacterium]|nr:CDP-alcohol phosphatidyltransferase family protein [Dethiobacter sp.]MBS3888081.1 CDP-alcohol phosphatidyltransferase family protein [Bacillota bacterium]